MFQTHILSHWRAVPKSNCLIIWLAILFSLCILQQLRACSHACVDGLIFSDDVLVSLAGWLAAAVMAIVIYSRPKEKENIHNTTKHNSNTQFYSFGALSDFLSQVYVLYMSFVSSHLCHAYDNDSFAAITFRFVF